MTIKFRKQATAIEAILKNTQGPFASAIMPNKAGGLRKAAGIRKCGEPEYKVWVDYWDGVFQHFAYMLGVSKSEAYFGFLTGQKGVDTLAKKHHAAVNRYRAALQEAMETKKRIAEGVVAPGGMQLHTALINGEPLTDRLDVKSNDIGDAEARVYDYWDRSMSTQAFAFDFGYDVTQPNVRKSRMPKELGGAFKKKAPRKKGEPTYVAGKMKTPVVERAQKALEQSEARGFIKREGQVTLSPAAMASN